MSRKVIAGCVSIALPRVASAATVRGHAFKLAMTCSETVVSKIAERDGIGKLWRLRDRETLRGVTWRGSIEAG